MPALRKFSAGISFVAMMMSMHSEESALEAKSRSLAYSPVVLPLGAESNPPCGR
jgi:hypothetical protein